jgi:hypothetical protein
MKGPGAEARRSFQLARKSVTLDTRPAFFRVARYTGGYRILPENK